MQTTFNLISWHDRGAILEERKVSPQQLNFVIPADTLRYLMGLWIIFNKPKHVIVTEDNQLLLHANF